MQSNITSSSKYRWLWSVCKEYVFCNHVQFWIWPGLKDWSDIYYVISVHAFICFVILCLYSTYLWSSFISIFCNWSDTILFKHWFVLYFSAYTAISLIKFYQYILQNNCAVAVKRFVMISMCKQSIGLHECPPVKHTACKWQYQDHWMGWVGPCTVPTSSLRFGMVGMSCMVQQQDQTLWNRWKFVLVNDLEEILHAFRCACQEELVRCEAMFRRRGGCSSIPRSHVNICWFWEERCSVSNKCQYH